MDPNPKQALALWRMLTAETLEVAEPKLSDVRPQLTPKERQQLLDAGYVSLRPGDGRATHLVLEDQAWQWASEADTVEVATSDVGAEVLQALLQLLIPFLQRQGIPLADVLRRVPSILTVAKPQAQPKRVKQAPTKSKRSATKKTASKSKRAVTKKTASKSKRAITKKAPTKPKRSTAKKTTTKPRRPTKPKKLPTKPSDLDAETTPHNQVLSALRSLAQGTTTGAVRLAALRSALGQVDRANVDRALRSLRDDRIIILYQDDDRASLTQADHEAALIEADTPRHLVYLENR